MASSISAACRRRAAGGLQSCGSTFRRLLSTTNHQRNMFDLKTGAWPAQAIQATNDTNGIDLSSLTKDSVVFSGIQPTGVPHIGNYFGALRQWKTMQDAAPLDAKLLFSIVDWHAITMPQDANILVQKKAEMFAALLAIGLDPERSIIFHQSQVPAHTELMWILSCTASMGYLNRMTQWKSKIQVDDSADGFDIDVSQKLKLGLFSYPVLQAADILVHRATHVPVGEDQKQHLEFSRECVTNFNHTYKTSSLVSPSTITTPSPRIMSLTAPHRKMSKSSPAAASRIDITSTPEAIRKQISSAVTDSLNAVTWDPSNRPGVTNLLSILSQCSSSSPNGATTPEGCAASLEGASLRDLKQMTADALVKELDGVRDKYQFYLRAKGGKYLQELQEVGGIEARKSAEATMKLVREAVGLANMVVVPELPTAAGGNEWETAAAGKKTKSSSMASGKAGEPVDSAQGWDAFEQAMKGGRR